MHLAAWGVPGLQLEDPAWSPLTIGATAKCIMVMKSLSSRLFLPPGTSGSLSLIPNTR